MVPTSQDNQNRRSDLLRRKRLLENEQRLQRKSAHAVDRIKEKRPAGKQINLLKLKSKKEAGDIKFHSMPDQFRNTQDASEKNAKKKPRVGWRLASGFLVVLFSSLLISAWRSPDYKVREVIVNGNQRITQEEILHSFEWVDTPIFIVDPGYVTSALLDAFPEFKEIKVDLVLPNQILITISERQPAITWKVGDNLLWIDGEGYILPVRGSAGDTLTVESFSYPAFFYPNLEEREEISLQKAHPRLNDWSEPSTSMVWYAYHRQIDPGLLNAITNLNSIIPHEKVLLFDPHRGLGWNDQRGWKIYVGFNLEHIGEKWLMYEKIVSELSKQGIQPTLISVEYLHAPYYRMD